MFSEKSITIELELFCDNDTREMLFNLFGCQWSWVYSFIIYHYHFIIYQSIDHFIDHGRLMIFVSFHTGFHVFECQTFSTVAATNERATAELFGDRSPYYAHKNSGKFRENFGKISEKFRENFGEISGKFRRNFGKISEKFLGFWRDFGRFCFGVFCVVLYDLVRFCEFVVIRSVLRLGKSKYHSQRYWTGAVQINGCFHK
jgi:hypothetical protein